MTDSAGRRVRLPVVASMAKIAAYVLLNRRLLAYIGVANRTTGRIGSEVVLYMAQ